MLIKKIRQLIYIILLISILNFWSITYVGYINNKFELVPTRFNLHNIAVYWTEIFSNNEKSVKTPQSAFYQEKDFTCGAAALRYLLYYYGIDIKEQQLAEMIGTDSTGSTMEGMVSALSDLGFEGVGVLANYSFLKDVKKPVIAFINGDHFVVVKKVTVNNVVIFDPSPKYGEVRVSVATFNKIWTGPLLIIKTKKIPIS